MKRKPQNRTSHRGHRRHTSITSFIADLFEKQEDSKTQYYSISFYFFASILVCVCVCVCVYDMFCNLVCKAPELSSLEALEVVTTRKVPDSGFRSRTLG